MIWSLVQGKLWGLDTIYRSLVASARRSFDTDSMGKWSIDEKVVVYGSVSFVMGVFQTRDNCILKLFVSLQGS